MEDDRFALDEDSLLEASAPNGEDAFEAQEPGPTAPTVSATGTLGYCTPEPVGLTIWGITFHLALFATFFALFFQFALKDRYTHSQESLARLFALLAQRDVGINARLVMGTQLNALATKAATAAAARAKKNGRAMALSLIPVVSLWAIVIVWGSGLRMHHVRVLPTIRGALGMFIAFVLAEMLIFVFVVKKYKPIEPQALVQLYKRALAARFAACKKTSTIGAIEPITSIVKALLNQP